MVGNFVQIDEGSNFPIVLNLKVLGESILKGGAEGEKEGAFHFVLTPSDNQSAQAISGGVVVKEGEGEEEKVVDSSAEMMELTQAIIKGEKEKIISLLDSGAVSVKG